MTRQRRVNFDSLNLASWWFQPIDLKNISQIESFRQVGVKIKDIWNHYLAGNSAGDLFGMVIRDPFKWLSDLQLGDEKVTKNHLEILHVEPKNHPIEKDNHLPSTSIFSFKMLIFQGIDSYDNWELVTFLVGGGTNPFEKYDRQNGWKSSPNK